MGVGTGLRFGGTDSGSAERGRASVSGVDSESIFFLLSGLF
jgi:hypothetical protein